MELKDKTDKQINPVNVCNLDNLFSAIIWYKLLLERLI